MNLPELARRQAVLATLLAAVKEEHDAARAATQAALDKAAEEMGVTAVTAKINGVDVGKISLTRSNPKAVITSPTAWLAWVEEHHPAAVIRTVNPSWEKAILAAASKAGAAVDPETGEVLAGVEMTEPGPAGHRLTAVRGARAIVAEAWAAGELAEMVALALEGGDR